MPKVYLAKKGRDHTSIQFWCNGCRSYHSLPSSRYKFDGNLDSPTITPDVNLPHGGGRFCHFTVTKGRIDYMLDSYQHLAGQTIDMTELK